MKHHLFLIFGLFLICGWNWQTHPAFVESIYYQLSDADRSYFNVTALQEGSLAPDRDFHDTRYHHYPPSYNLTLYWLQKARTSYDQGNFPEASYAFGVASHYVSDSFAAPHNIEKESSKDHSFYERQASERYMLVPCPSNFSLVDINATLLRATATGKTWSSWLATKDSNYPEQAVAHSMEPLYHLFWQTFNITCVKKETFYGQGDWLPEHPGTLIAVAVTFYCFLEILISLIKPQ